MTSAPPQAQGSSSKPRRQWNRADQDAFYEKFSYPRPCPKLRKWQYLGVTTSGPMHDRLLQLLWLPLGLVLFAAVLVTNLLYLAWTMLIHGGIRNQALRTTQPKGNLLIRWILSFIDIMNVTEIPKAWDPDKAATAYENFCLRNGFADGDVRFEIRRIPDDVDIREIVHKHHQSELHPAGLHRVWVLLAPSKTYVCTVAHFTEFDGTSVFNLVKGYVETYYEGKAPLVRPQPHTELDLQLTDDPKVLNELTVRKALVVCFVTAYRFGYCYGRYLLSREVFDMLGCASPEVCVAIEWLDQDETAAMVANLKGGGKKMFSHLLASSAKAAQECTPKVDRPVLLTQVSCQSRYYEPTIAERNVCGNWLIATGSKPQLDQLGSPAWCHAYYQRLRHDLEHFTDSVAFGFLGQVLLGFNATALWANPRHVYWFNNYGRRSMHPDAGGVRYFWGPHYAIACYFLVNAITVDGTTCLTLMSSVLKAGELEHAAKRMKALLIRDAAHPVEEENGTTTTKDKEA